MLKTQQLRFLLIISLIVTISLLTGCGLLFGPEETMEIDPPPVTLELDSNVVDIVTNPANNSDNETLVSNQEEIVTVNLTIYFFDEKGDVVPLTMSIPKVEGIGKEVLKYMTVGGPAESIIPTGFIPVIPAGTSFDMNIKAEQKLAIIDFSKEFLNYEAKSPAEEKKILDAITWSITEFPTVEQVELRVNGFPLEAMPTWNTPIVGPLSRVDGINLELANNIDVSNTTSVTLYFNRATASFEYLVPVTRLIPKIDDIAKATLEQLIIGPRAGSSLTSSLLPTTKILSVKVSNDLLVADFDDELLGFNNQLTDKLINTLMWSLSENTGVPTIQIKIKGETNSLPDNLAKPILKPETINATLF